MENLNQQVMGLLARKAVLLEELKSIDNKLGQIAAITQYLNETQTSEEKANPLSE